jgi:ribosomal protein L25 (general stress protein Ctc)
MAQASTNILEASERDTTLNPRQLRASGFIPVTVYGNGQTPISLQIPTHAFEMAWQHGLRNFDLQLSGKTLKVTLKQFQQNARTQKFQCLEFMHAAA